MRSSICKADGFLELCYRVFQRPLSFASQPEIPMRQGKAGVHLDCLLQWFYCPIVRRDIEVVPPLVRIDGQIQRIQLESTPARVESFFVATHGDQIMRVPMES